MSEAPSARRPGVIRRSAGWAAQSMVLPFPRDEIRREAQSIRRSIEVLRRKPAAEPEIHLTADGRFDLEATAAAIRARALKDLPRNPAARDDLELLAGLQPEDVSNLLWARRKQLQQRFHLNVGVAVIVVAMWFWATLHTGIGWLTTLSGLSFFLLLAIRAFVDARMIWRIRTGRMGSTWEFLFSGTPEA